MCVTGNQATPEACPFGMFEDYARGYTEDKQANRLIDISAVAQEGSYEPETQLFTGKHKPVHEKSAAFSHWA